MAQRPALRTAAVILGGAIFFAFLIAGIADWAAVAKSPRLTTFEQAEFVASNARRPPDDRAAWKTVKLPDEWRNRPDLGAHGWYRIRLTLDRVPEGLQTILVRYRRARRLSFFVNGKHVGGAIQASSISAERGGVRADIVAEASASPSMLRAGENMIYVRMEASTHPALMHGLGRVYFGDAQPVRRMLVWFGEQGMSAMRNATAMALAAGIITLFLWLARRNDRVTLWFSIACLSWGLAGYFYWKLRYVVPNELSSVLYFYVSYGLVVPTVILSLRSVDLKWPRFEAALWLFFLFELSYPLWPGKPWPASLLTWDAANALLLMGTAGVVLCSAERRFGWPTKLQVAALAAMAVAISYEIARFLGWVDVESPVIRPYHVPVMVLAMGAACFQRYGRAIAQTRRMNVELAQRVADKAQEIEANHARLTEALRERTLSDERQRILSDMHDSLGASLAGLLLHVEGGHADTASVRRRVQEALQEMRVAVSALQPGAGDLGAVLGSLRDRLDGLFSGSGVQLVWQVDALPSTELLTPSSAFSLQRIVLEAVGNALKHSGATQLRVVARLLGDDTIEICIEDNGRGFDPERVRGGLGLDSMRARAERIGMHLRTVSRPGDGTAVRLTLPRPALAGAAERTQREAGSTRSLGLVPAARNAIVAVIAVVSLPFIAAPSWVDAASPPKIIQFEQGEFVPSDATRPPDALSPWKPIQLPDQWRTRPDSGRQGWYRMKFNLDSIPRGLQIVVVRHLRADELAFFVNGNLVGTATDNQSMASKLTGRAMGTPVRHNVPASMLRAGENVIHVRMEASSESALMHGLGRVYFGAAGPVRRIDRWAIELGFTMKRELTFMMLAAGLIALFLWFARPNDRVMFWFSITCLSWGGVGFVYLMWRWSELVLVSNSLHFFQVYGLVVPVVILSLRAVELKWPRAEAALWLFFIVQLTYPLWARSWPVMHLVWDAAHTGLLLMASGVMFQAARRPIGWPITLQLVALVTMAAVMFCEIARYLVWVDVESPVIRHYHVPLMLIAMGAACFDRYAREVRQAERTTVELEQRVAEKAQEIEENHARLDEALRERTLAEERQRVLADMHDGLGASFVSLLRYLDSGRADMEDIKRRVREALREMRLTFNTLQPHGGNLATVLGSLRERLDSLIAGSGVRLVWQVDELPQVDELTPSVVFSLHRIVLEAVANALKHSSAKEVRLIASARGGGNIEIRVEDDGVGSAPDADRPESRVADMRARAERMGAKLEIGTQREAGTTVRLTIPRVRAARFAEVTSGETEAVPANRALPVAETA
jgi:signal transduction histidine kinase